MANGRHRTAYWARPPVYPLRSLCRGVDRAIGSRYNLSVAWIARSVAGSATYSDSVVDWKQQLVRVWETVGNNVHNKPVLVCVTLIHSHARRRCRSADENGVEAADAFESRALSLMQRSGYGRHRIKWYWHQMRNVVDIKRRRHQPSNLCARDSEWM